MKNLRNEEAVSPVIGVILMVVITVIIAAVLAVFAFGVGAPTDTPQASIKITAVNATNDTVWVQHYGGDSLRMKDIKITVETLNGDGSILNTTSLDVGATVSNSFEAGDTLTIDAGTPDLRLNGVTIKLGPSLGMVVLGGESIRVTVIDTPSGSVLSKPAAKIT
jgi:flagellin-like protein